MIRARLRKGEFIMKRDSKSEKWVFFTTLRNVVSNLFLYLPLKIIINPFLTSLPISYPLKTPVSQLTFLTLWYAHVRVDVRGLVRNVVVFLMLLNQNFLTRWFLGVFRGYKTETIRNGSKLSNYRFSLQSSAQANQQCQVLSD